MQARSCHSPSAFADTAGRGGATMVMGHKRDRSRSRWAQWGGVAWPAACYKITEQNHYQLSGRPPTWILSLASIRLSAAKAYLPRGQRSCRLFAMNCVGSRRAMPLLHKGISGAGAAFPLFSVPFWDCARGRFRPYTTFGSHPLSTASSPAPPCAHSRCVVSPVYLFIQSLPPSQELPQLRHGGT